MIGLQHIIDSKRELLSRETYSRNPINYSEGMADDQKDRFIQYLAEQHQEDELTIKAMKLVLEDFMAQMKELKDQVSSMQSKQSDLENRLSEERKLRQSAELKLNRTLLTDKRRKMIDGTDDIGAAANAYRLFRCKINNLQAARLLILQAEDY